MEDTTRNAAPHDGEQDTQNPAADETPSSTTVEGVDDTPLPHRVAALPGHVWRIPQKLPLDSGVDLDDVEVSNQPYGTLNESKTNAILVCHALTGDQFLAQPHPITGKEGWWSSLVGLGQIIDTQRYFIICANVLGGCRGSTGPMQINPETGKPFGVSFPVITVADMVRAQVCLIDHLGIEKLF